MPRAGDLERRALHSPMLGLGKSATEEAALRTTADSTWFAIWGHPYGAHPAQRGLDNDSRWDDRGQPLEHGRRGGSTGRCGADPADPAESSAHRPPGGVEPRSGWGLTPG